MKDSLAVEDLRAKVGAISGKADPKCVVAAIHRQMLAKISNAARLIAAALPLASNQASATLLTTTVIQKVN